MHIRSPFRIGFFAALLPAWQFFCFIAHAAVAPHEKRWSKGR